MITITVNNIIEAKEIFNQFVDAFEYSCDDNHGFMPVYCKLEDAIEKDRFPIEIDEWWHEGNRIVTGWSQDESYQ